MNWYSDNNNKDNLEYTLCAALELDNQYQNNIL